MVSCFCIVVAIHISAYMFLVCDFMRFTDLLFRVTNIQIFFNVTKSCVFFFVAGFTVLKGEKKRRGHRLVASLVCVGLWKPVVLRIIAGWRFKKKL